MERTPAYWATIAQIAPVLMLALVVEGRFFSRQLARKKSFPHNRKLRIAYALLFLANCIVLYMGFQFALDGAAGRDLSSLEIDLVEIGTSLVVGTVFLTPALGIGSGLMGDWFIATHRRRSYSRVGRANTRLRRRMRDLDALLRLFQDRSLAMRSEIAAEYVAAYRELSTKSLDRASRVRLDAKFGELANRTAELNALRHDLHEHVESILEMQREIEAGRNLSDGDLDLVRTFIRDATG